MTSLGLPTGAALRRLLTSLGLAASLALIAAIVFGGASDGGALAVILARM